MIGSAGYCPSRLTRHARYRTPGCGSRLPITTARKPSSSPRASSVSARSTSRTWLSRCRSSFVGKTLSTTSWVTSRQAPLGTSASEPRWTPGVTQSATGTSVSSCASPSAISTSASHGVGVVVTSPSRSSERSHGRVRRRSTICGSREVNEPRAPAGGKVLRIWSGGIAYRGASISTRERSGSTAPGMPDTSPVSRYEPAGTGGSTKGTRRKCPVGSGSGGIRDPSTRRRRCRWRRAPGRGRRR